MDYTDSQRDAIGTIDKNLQIIACAGSGKTQVISERIVGILKNEPGVTAANIVAFTFTGKAAGELKDRIHRLCREQLGTDRGLPRCSSARFMRFASTYCNRLRYTVT